MIFFTDVLAGSQQRSLEQRTGIKSFEKDVIFDNIKIFRQYYWNNCTI